MKPTYPNFTALQISTWYATRIVSGEIPAGKWVKLTCQQFLDRAAGDSELYYFDGDAANRFVKFAQMLEHVKGRWARGKERIVLEPWQVFIFANIFGWKERATGLRQYREAYIKVPRKNGKSFIAASVGLYMFALDGEPGAEVYCAATTKSQSFEVFSPAKLMVRKAKGFIRKYSISVNAESITTPDGSRFLPVIGDPPDGSSPHCAILDERHQWTNDNAFDTMITGAGAREQPLILTITTAGFGVQSPCLLYEKDCEAILLGTTQDTRTFSMMYGTDQDDKWDNPATLRKANPNIGVSISEEYLLDQLNKAKNAPRKQGIFKTKHLNQWQSAANAFVNIAHLDSSIDESLSPMQFFGETKYGGMDLASKVDLAAVVDLYVKSVAGVDHFYAFTRAYCPDSALIDGTNDRLYREWQKTGDLIATPGNITDFNTIEDDIRESSDLSRYDAIGYDQYGASQMASSLFADSIPMVEVPQTVKFLSEPLKWLEALLKDGRFHFDGNRVLYWCLSNVEVLEDRNQNIFPRKASLSQKIDAAAALLNALCCAFSNSEDSVNLGHMPEQDIPS